MIDNDYSQCVKLKKAAYCMPDAERRHVAKVALRPGLNKRKKPGQSESARAECV